MGMNKARIGFILGIIVALLIGTADIPGLARNGQICMALSFMTVIFWGFQITQPGYTSGLYLLLLAVFGVEKPALIFSTWTGPMMFLIVGAYLIAGAVKESGLGERIAYKFIISYVTSFKSIIVAIFILTFILSLLIPHPWPRAFLIMSVMAVVIKSANIPRVDAVKIGFTVFAASVPVSLIFLTGDATISPLAVQSSGVSLGWLGWFKLMGPPSIIVSIITCFMILFLFKPTQEVQVNKEEMRAKLAAMGPMSGKELRTAFWVTLAIILWSAWRRYRLGNLVYRNGNEPAFGWRNSDAGKLERCSSACTDFFDCCCCYRTCWRRYRYECMDSPDSIAWYSSV